MWFIQLVVAASFPRHCLFVHAELSHMYWLNKGLNAIQSHGLNLHSTWSRSLDYRQVNALVACSIINSINTSE